jgi:hypothetical protein
MAITLDGTDGVTTTGLTSNGIDDNATSTAITIDSSQNVGIGTAAPESIVHIKDSGNVSTTLQIESAASQYAPVINFDGIVGASADYILGEINGSWDTHTNVVSAIRFESGADTTNKDDGLISFWTSSSGPTLTEAMRIDSSGNVGIGTTTPNAAYALDVVGNIRATNSAGSTIVVNRTSNPGSVELQHSGTQTAQFSAVSGGGVSTYVGSTPIEAMRIDSSGNVGIGTTPESNWRSIDKAVQVGPSGVLRGQTNAALIEIGSNYYINPSSQSVYINSDSATRMGQYQGSFTFERAPSGTAGSAFSWSESMRINASGQLLVGTTSTYSTSPKSAIGGALGGGTGLELLNTSGVSWIPIRFHTASTLAGYISSTTTTTSYVTSSDQRLKENIVDAPAGNIDAIRVRSFDWKADGLHQTYGMVAQELVNVAPEAVSQGETEDDTWGVDYSKLVPMLVKEIQDLRKRVADLEG